MQFIFRPRLMTILAMFFFTASQIACTSTPQIKPDYTGIAHLIASQAVKARYPSAIILPQINSGDVRTPYQIGVQDELIISVWGREDLGSQIPTDVAGRIRTTRVRESGNITLPLVGTLSIVGKTVEQAHEMIARRHDRKLDIFHVDVRLHSCHSQAVNITGAVNKPGLYYLCDRVSTFGHVLSAAQGLSTDAYAAGGVLMREGQTYRLDYPLNEDSSPYLDILLRAGDYIFFPRNAEGTEPVVYVFGEVGKQGVYIIPPKGMTLLDALGQASGPRSVTAKIDAIYIMRKVPGTGQLTTYQVTLAELFENPDIELADGDRIFIAPGDLSRWDRWWRQAIPFTIRIRGPEL